MGAIAIAAAAYRLIIRGSGRDLGLCSPVPWLVSGCWVLAIAVGGHALQAVIAPGDFPLVDIAFAQITGPAGSSGVRFGLMLAAVAVVAVATEFVSLGLIHRGIRDCLFGIVGRWVALAAGVAAQVVVLSLTGLVQPTQIGQVVFSVVVASLAYELTSALWVPAVGGALYGALYFAISQVPIPDNGSLALVALSLVAIPAAAGAVICWLCRVLGTSTRIAAVQ